MSTFVNSDFRWRLPAPLAADAAERLRAVPGVQVWTSEPVIRCAYGHRNAIRPLVQAAAEASGIAWSRVRVSTDFTGLRPLRLPECVRAVWTGGTLGDNSTGITATPYQKTGVRGLFALGGGLVEAPAGSGKTVIGDIAALADAHARGMDGAVLLTVCKSGARVQQAREKRRFYGVAPFVVKPGATPADLQAYLDRVDLPYGLRWIIVGWDHLRTWGDLLIKIAPCAVVLDEAHYAKATDRVKFRIYVDEETADGVRFDREERNNRSAWTARLVDAIPSRYLTTATPLANRLNDWWALGNLIERPGFGSFVMDPWGPTVSKYLIRYCNGTPGEWGGIVTVKPHYSNVSEFRARLKSVRYVVPYAVLAAQLPPTKRRVHKVLADEQDRPLALSREDRAAYRKVLKEASELQRKVGAKLGDAGATADFDASKTRLTILRLEDACNRKRSATFNVVREYIDGAAGRPDDPRIPRGKVLVFYGLQRALGDVARKVRRHVDDVWIASGAGCYHLGRTADEDVRVTVDAMKDAYMATHRPAVIVGTYQFLGESHNLQDTDAIVVGMLPWTPHMLAQIKGRGARLGQSRPMDIVFMQAAGTADDRLVELAVDKLEAVEALGDGAHGLEGTASALRGTDQMQAVFDAFVTACLAMP